MITNLKGTPTIVIGKKAGELNKLLEEKTIKAKIKRKLETTLKNYGILANNVQKVWDVLNDYLTSLNEDAEANTSKIEDITKKINDLSILGGDVHISYNFINEIIKDIKNRITDINDAINSYAIPNAKTNIDKAYNIRLKNYINRLKAIITYISNNYPDVDLVGYDDTLDALDETEIDTGEAFQNTTRKYYDLDSDTHYSDEDVALLKKIINLLATDKLTDEEKAKIVAALDTNSDNELNKIDLEEFKGYITDYNTNYEEQDIANPYKDIPVNEPNAAVKEALDIYEEAKDRDDHHDETVVFDEFYNFESYSIDENNQAGDKYAEGKVQVTSSKIITDYAAAHTWQEIEVIENDPDPTWIGRKFWILIDAKIDNGSINNIYVKVDGDNRPQLMEGIGVKIYSIKEDDTPKYYVGTVAPTAIDDFWKELTSTDEIHIYKENDVATKWYIAVPTGNYKFVNDSSEDESKFYESVESSIEGYVIYKSLYNDSDSINVTMIKQ